MAGRAGSSPARPAELRELRRKAGCMEILSETYPAVLSPSSMDPRPAVPDDPRVLQVLPGSPPGPGLSAADGADPPGELALGWPPWKARQPAGTPPALGPGWQYTVSGQAADLPPRPAGQPPDALGLWREV